MITADEFRLIKKFMAVATSENDHEALEALRRANAILAKNSLTWEAVLTKTVAVGVEVEAAPFDPEQAPRPSGKPSPRKPKRIEDEATETLLLLAEEAAERQSPGTQEFVAKLRTQWEDKRWLSEPQRIRLREIKDR